MNTSDPATPGSSDARLALRALVTAAWQAQCVRAAADLDLPARLAAGPATSTVLAAACGAHEPSLRRLLRTLTAIGILDTDGQQYTLTPLGQALGSLGPWACYSCSDPAWAAWAGLADAIRTGQSAFARVHGMTPWEYHAAHPGAGARFQASMAAITAGAAAAIAASYDFSSCPVVCPVVADIGGGDGTLLAEILTRNPAIHGVLADLPPVLERARPVLAAAGVAGRCDLHASDFRDRVPAADVYLLKSVLHDWDDHDAAAILASCRHAARPDAQMIIIERVLPGQPGPGDLEALLTDLTMLVMLGGKERTQAAYHDLLTRAFFRPGPVIGTGTEFSLITATTTGARTPAPSQA
jgi:hypothetical protein